MFGFASFCVASNIVLEAARPFPPSMDLSSFPPLPSYSSSPSILGSPLPHSNINILPLRPSFWKYLLISQNDKSKSLPLTFVPSILKEVYFLKTNFVLVKRNGISPWLDMLLGKDLCMLRFLWLSTRSGVLRIVWSY